ncbi:MAG: two component system response regulator [Solirubrobacterales bacterium]|nr:two component system response regulator [Solirubrobacterales bacterium]
MLDSNTNTADPKGGLETLFSSIFGQSRIPMALLDRDRRYVTVNDALINFYEYPRSKLLGSVADSMVVDDSGGIDTRWEQLVRTNQLYGERVIAHSNGSQLQVSYAAHTTTLEGRWMALVVTLSARFQSGGPELIGAAPIETQRGGASTLTAREREIVRLLALGSTTRQVAAGLSLSPETIRSHVRNAMSKTGAHTRAQLVALELAEVAEGS